MNDFEYLPLTTQRWSDFERLFGPNGACAGCWCMWWRIKRSEFEKASGEVNRLAMKAIVESGEVPGLLAYPSGEGDAGAAAWVSVAPREAFPVLGRSPVLKPVDDQPVWSIVCFFFAREYRGQGLMERSILAAVDYARQNGARIVEGYPVDKDKKDLPGFSAFTGLPQAFQRAGFREVLRRSPTRPMMRIELEK